MKILHIAEGIQETCGVSCFVMEIAKAQAAAGHDVCIVTKTTCSYPVGSLVQKENIPYVLSPHGTLTPWALKYKWWKKIPAMVLYQYRDLKSAAAFHVTADSEIKIGKNVDIAPMVYLGTGTHVPQFDKERCAGEGLNKDIKIGDGCWLCARTTILPGVTVGNMTIVGAGAVVNKNLPGGITAVGIPAEPLEK